MKKSASTLIAAVSLVISMSVAIQAQTASQLRLKVNVPFGFMVLNQSLPAGEYTVSRINPASDVVIVQLHSKDGRSNAMVQMNFVAGDKLQDGGKLIFDRRGDQYFFAQVWLGGSSSGLQASKSRKEIAAERELANIKPETIVLSAHR